MPWKCLRLFFYLFIICKDFRLTSFIWLSYQKIFYATSKNFIKNDTFKIFIIAYCLNLFKDNMHKNTHKNMRLEPLEEVLWLLPHIYTVFRSCWHSRQLQLSVWDHGRETWTPWSPTALNGEDLLAILGSAGIRSYGYDENGRILHSHFHNLLEIGICRRGKGTLIFQNEKRFYTENSIYETGISAKINLSDKTGIYTDFYIAHQKLGEKSDDWCAVFNERIKKYRFIKF